MDPFNHQQNFNEYMIYPAQASKERRDYDKLIDLARSLHSHLYRIVFTCGDLMHHNISVKDGHVTGLIDREAAGSYPEYREFTTAWKYQPRNSCWWDFVRDHSVKEYVEESEGDRALRNLTSSSWAYWLSYVTC